MDTIDASRIAFKPTIIEQLHELTSRVQRDGGDCDALNQLGEFAAKSHQWQEAIRLFRQSLRAGGESAELLHALGCVYVETDDWDNAVRCFQRGVSRYPTSASCYISLAYRYNMEGKFDEAESLYLRAISTCQETTEAKYNLASHYREIGRLSDAVDLLEGLIKEFPTDARLHDQLGRALLQQGNWKSGWEKYEYRFLIPDRPRLNAFIPVPLWQGQALSNHHLLIHAEQGIGDEVQAASCYDEVISAAGKCTIVCSPRLVKIFKHSFPHANFIGVPESDRWRWSPDSADSFDFQISSGSLFLHFRTNRQSFPGQAYLSPLDTNDISHCRQPAEPKSTSQRRIGLSWFGGTNSEQQRRRSLPVEQMDRLRLIPNTKFLCVQHGCQCHRRRFGNRGLPWEQTAHWLECDPELNPYHDLTRWFARIASLDLLISVDNSNVHFAGAMGIPTWSIFSESVDWRWPIDGSRCPWYSSVDLIQKKVGESWESIFSNVINRLEAESH